MTARSAWFLSCLLMAGAAHAGSAPAELSCVSDSGNVALKGVIPSPSSEELNLTLHYFDARQPYTSDTLDNSYAVSDFPHSVFTLLLPTPGLALTLYALPESMGAEIAGDGAVVAKFEAKLMAPRPRSKTGVQSDSPLKALLNCNYRYSL